MIQLEHLADNSVSDRNFQKLMSVVPDMGGQSVGIRFGTVTITFPGGSPNGQATVPHGLGRVPASFSATLTGASDVIPIIQAGTFDATNFVLVASTKTGANLAAGQQRSFFWMVIG